MSFDGDKHHRITPSRSGLLSPREHCVKVWYALPREMVDRLKQTAQAPAPAMMEPRRCRRLRSSSVARASRIDDRDYSQDAAATAYPRSSGWSLSEMHGAMLVVLVAAVMLIGGCTQPASTEDSGRKLAKKLQSEDEEERYDAAKEFEALGERAAAHVGVIGGALRDSSAKVRYRCAKALSKMGDAAAPAVVLLAEALRDEDAKVRQYAAKALANLDENAHRALEALLAASQDEQAEVRYYAVKAIGNIEEETAAVIEALERCQQDADEKIQKAATSALKKVRL